MRTVRDSMMSVAIAGLTAMAGCLSQPGGTQPAGRQFPWVGNKLGITDSVPDPWVPLQVQGDVVTYWGGRIAFDGGLLPTQITSQDTELLSRPVTFVVKVGGKTVELPGNVATTFGPKSDAAVTVKTQADVSQLAIKCSHTVEYDGMIRTDAVFTAQRPVRIDSLTLQVPVRGEIADYFRRFHTYDFDEEKADRDDFTELAGSARQAWQIPFSPYVWLGRPESGIEWFCEGDEVWKPWGRPNALALQPGATETVLEARMITNATQLRAGQSWSVTFGLSPTPSKPRRADWRTYRWGGRTNQPPPEVSTQAYTVFAVFWINENESLALERPGFPWPLDPAAYGPARDQLRQQGVLYIPYGSLFKMDTNIPEWNVYAKDWDGGRQRSFWTGREEGSRPRSICVSSQTFRDYQVWTYVDALRRLDTDGLFFDFGSIGLNCINPNHPHGGLMEQGIYHTELFTLRDLYKRLYVATREVKPGFLTVVHGMLPVMCSSFIDAAVFGEQTQELFNKSDLPVFRADTQLAGRKWYVPDYCDDWPVDWALPHLARGDGTFTVLLPQILKHNKEYYRSHQDELKAYTRGMLALAAVTDVHTVWTILADLPLMRQFSVAKDKFGPITDDVESYPAWRSPVVIEPQLPGVYASLYTRPGQALLIVSNLGPAAATVTVDPGLAKLGVTLGQQKAIDAMSNQSLPLDAQGKVSLTVQGKDFVIVSLG